MTPAMATRDTCALRIQAHSEIAKLAKLSHSRLRTGERRADAHPNRQSAVHSTVNATSGWGKASGLKGQDLVLGELLLVKRLLLLLQGFDLGLNGDLEEGPRLDWL